MKKHRRVFVGGLCQDSGLQLCWGSFAAAAAVLRVLSTGRVYVVGRGGEGDGTHSSTLAWKIPWMEEPGRLQSMGSLRVGHD